MKKLLVVLCAASLLPAASCKKKDKDPTPQEMLQNGKWKITAATFGIFNLLDQMEDCQKDNLYTFNPSKSVTIDEGASKCGSEQTYTDGTWALENNNTKLTLSGSSVGKSFGLDESLSAQVTTLNSTTLSLKKDTSVNRFAGSIIITFSNTASK